MVQTQEDKEYLWRTVSISERGRAVLPAALRRELDVYGEKGRVIINLGDYYDSTTDDAKPLVTFVTVDEHGRFTVPELERQIAEIDGEDVDMSIGFLQP